MNAIDTIANITPQTALALKQQGVGAVFGYLGHWPKCLTSDRVKVLVDAGLQIGFFFEGAGATFGAAQGHADASEALHYANVLGVPRGVGIGICPAVDYDAQPGDYAKIRAHWRAWRALLGKDFRLGMYAGSRVLTAMKGEYDYAIEPSSWSGGQQMPGIAMYQNSVSTQLCGIGVDLDDLYDASILWNPKGVGQMSYPAVKVMFGGKQYPALNINNKTYFIWTLARDAGCNLTKVQYNDVEIDGKKPRQWADGKNTYLCYADVPGIHPVGLADGSGWEFVKDTAPPVATVTRKLLGTFTGDVLQDAFFFQPTTHGGTFGHFQWDTGAWEFVLALRIANDLNLPNLGPAVQTYGAGTHKAHYSEIDIVIGDTVFAKQPCVVDEEWPEESVEFPSDGLFGLRFFLDNKLPFHFDPATATLSIFTAQ